jgi:metal-responsive CopG/Arc/MetJ family transcriptional regulator
MERFTISLDENLADAFDSLIMERGYATRSEAVRDIFSASQAARIAGISIGIRCVLPVVVKIAHQKSAQRSGRVAYRSIPS